mgnify:CR=1 FL=1
MNEQEKLSNEYMTGWEIVGGFITLGFVFLSSYLMLFIGVA